MIGVSQLRAFGRDVTHAVRSLAKARGFTFVCVVSLGIGMGTVIGILILLRLFGPPAAINTEGMVELLVRPQGKLREQVGGRLIETWSYPDYGEIRDANTGMEITAWTTAQENFRFPNGGAARMNTMYVSANYFRTVGVTLERGAGFEPRVDMDAPAQPVVIISHDVWQNQLGADPDILGKTVALNRVQHTVVGIVPDGFHGHMNSEASPRAHLWVPLRQHPRLRADESLRLNRDIDWVRIHGRLSPGVSIERANSAVQGVMLGLAQRYPVSNAFKEASVEPYLALGARGRTEFGVIRAMFLSMAGLVLLIVCLNISGMVLVRTAMRERELSIRQAIGADRRSLIRYLLSEAIVMATLAGGLASSLLFGIPAAISWWFGRPVPAQLAPDAPMFAFCVLLCLVTSLMFGLMPAIRFSRPMSISALKDETGGGGRRVGRVHRLTAAIQVGIAVPFLVVGGVLLDHVRTAATAELGFEPAHLIAAPVDLAGAGDSDERAAVMLRAARENLARTSGITSVALADGLPLDFESRVIRVVREDDATPVFVRPTRVDEGYLKTMGIRLMRGRDITVDDRAGAEFVALISKPLAAKLFPNVDPLQQRLTLSLEENVPKVVTIVGVIDDLVGSQLSNPRAEMLLPLAQHPASTFYLIGHSVEGNTAATLAPVFRNALRDLNPEFDTAGITTGEMLVRNSTEDIITQSAVAGAGGVVALTLAALGVYGVIGFMVAMRRREIAVRIALGASHWGVVRIVLTDVAKLVAPGVILGLIAAVFLVRSTYLSWYPLGVVEHLVYAVAACITVSIALLAGLPSARRAAAVEPMAAMRSE